MEMWPGVLALRGVGFILGVAGGKEGGAESWRGLAVWGEGILDLVVGSLQEALARENVLFDDVMTLNPTSTTTDGKKMECAGCRGCGGLSPITRDFANWAHNESRSMMDVGGLWGEAAGLRGHSTV